MFSSIAVVAVISGLLSGAGTGWVYSRVLKARLHDRLDARLKVAIEQLYEELADELRDLASREVSVGMSEILSAMAAAEQQKMQMAQAQAQAEEINRLRALAQRAQQQVQTPPEVLDALADMNARISGVAGKMRQMGVGPQGN